VSAERAAPTRGLPSAARRGLRAHAALGPDELVERTRAMGGDVTVRAASRRMRPADGAAHAPLDAAVARALEIFHEVDRACTCSDATSALARANAAPDQWHVVPDLLVAAVAESHDAYKRSSGRFDPRVPPPSAARGHGERAGPTGEAELGARATPGRATGPSGAWRPQVRHAHRAIHLGGAPIDLGPIAKGLAVRWAATAVASAATDFLVWAGDVVFCAGRAPDGGPWRLGVEDPCGGGAPVAVLALGDTGAATSSSCAPRWTVDGTPTHDLVDPSTGRPGGEGLSSVTVVARDPATAGVWSKALFLAGASGVEAAARQASVAALWVGSDGWRGHTQELVPVLERQAP